MLSIEEMIQKGWGRVANTGAFSGGVQGGGAGGVILIDEPELIIGIPDGVCVRPLRISAQVQPGAIGGDAKETEILIGVDSLGLWRGDGGGTPETPTNMRTDIDKGTSCRVDSAVTGALTTTPGFAVSAGLDPVVDLELAREVLHYDQGSDANNTQMILDIVYEPKYPPYLIGPCTLLVYFGGSDNTVGGFVQAAWVEGPKDMMVPAL